MAFWTLSPDGVLAWVVPAHWSYAAALGEDSELSDEESTRLKDALRERDAKWVAQDDLTVHYGPETGARTGGQRRSSQNSRQGDGALQAFEVGCGVPVGGLQADYEASARLPKTETRNLLDGHSSWWHLRAEAVISYLKMPFWRARIVWKTGRTKTSEEGKRCETRGGFCRACLREQWPAPLRHCS